LVRLPWALTRNTPEPEVGTLELEEVTVTLELERELLVVGTLELELLVAGVLELERELLVTGVLELERLLELRTSLEDVAQLVRP